MKSIRTLALVTGLLGLCGVAQAQFSSTWTFVSDYDFRGVSQSGKDPAVQASADYAFGESGFAVGVWASNVDWGVDDDLELDYYFSYTASINDTFSIVTGATYYDYPLGPDLSGYAEVYAGINAGNFGFKHWYAWDNYASDVSAQYTEANYTQPIGENFSLGFHAGYSWGSYWDENETIDYAVQANYTAGKVTFFGKFTGTDASGDAKVRDDIGNNEPRFLIGLMMTAPFD
jgi:uncharacterized protein (TIGR02001 family)